MSRPTHMMTVTLLLAVVAGPALAQEQPPLPLTNTKSGISVGLSGTNGRDWAVEQTCHDASIGDQVIYLQPDVEISLAHNERNSLMKYERGIERICGVNGPDGQPDSGDEGLIHYKIDRDLQAHRYCSDRSPLADWTPAYTTPIRLDRLTYDGQRTVLGAIGDNGGPWGTEPSNTTKRFAYGQKDASGNEWHTLTYWDNDIPVYKKLGKSPHRQGASDGHCLAVCVAPLTPVIQLRAAGAEQFYTTPIKTYQVPRIWPQTTYLTGGATVAFVNLTNAKPVMYRVDAGDFKTYGGMPLAASDVFTKEDAESVLEVKCGADGAVLRRTVVLNPGFPGPDEKHGFLLWSDEEERAAMVKRVTSVAPFKQSYNTFRSGYYQGDNVESTDVRAGWRGGASQASLSLANAFVVAVEGPAKRRDAAVLAKTRLLRLARLQPVGNEADVNHGTPAKDFLNELGQTIQRFADAGVAYDLLAGLFRRTDHPDGLTPIEEIIIRDGLAKIAKTTLQFRANYSFTNGSGDSHWPHGFELMLTSIAMAMPTYRTLHYGVSGGDRTTVNDLAGEDGKYWNPFPDQGVTWYAAATDPAVATPGHPNVKGPFRAEFIYGDDGYWTGPNDLQGDGARYVTGITGNRLVDVKHGGLSNAEDRVELVEMHGYEGPFVTRTYVVDLMRRIAGDTNRAACVTRYINRRLVGGVPLLRWDADSGTYGSQHLTAGLHAFNRHYPLASSPGARAHVGRFLAELTTYYGGPGELDPARRKRITDDERKWFYTVYALALCESPGKLPAWQPGATNEPPILKPMFKYVVAPGTPIVKDIIALDMDGGPLKVTVADLPEGAAFDEDARRITWTPGAGDLGVHVVNVTVSDGQAGMSHPFPIIVKATPGKGTAPRPPASLEAAVIEDGAAVELKWPSAGPDVAAYVVYRDGALWAVTDAATTRFVDRVFIEPGSHTRYDIACYNRIGAESSATSARPAIISIPATTPRP